MTYDEFVKIALELPGTTEEVGKSGPSVNRDGRSMFWLKKWELLCVKVDWKSHDRLLDEHPEVIYTTPHFHTYPAVHANLDLLTTELARDLIRISWDDAHCKVKFRKTPNAESPL
ncbi:MAG: hypothetical protein WCI55_10185 [Armatimonadota bacterium]